MGSKMSLSKSKSRESGQYTSQKNPMLLPPVLDVLFPYMTFSDLKSSRLVCSTWDAIALPLIARKELKPVNSSYITYKDIPSLKILMQMSDAKRKLYQQFFKKFLLTWKQVSKIDNFNFMDSFFPSEIFISGNDVVDPSTSLMMLISPIVTTLTRLQLEIKWVGMPSFNLGCLIGLGMRLQDLNLNIYQDNEMQNGNAPFLWGVSDLIWSQASTLENLFFRAFVVIAGPIDDVFGSRIKLPSFPKIRSLDFQEGKKGSNGVVTFFSG